MSEYVIGIDLGGTQIRVVLANLDGKILDRKSTLTHAEEGPGAVIDRIREQTKLAMGEYTIRAIGIGAPGPTDPYKGVILMGPNLPGWRNVNLRTQLGDYFDVPTYVGNDANVAGLAEHRFGAGQGVRHMVYITVSTGIGSGVIIDSRMLLGRQGLAAEIGHMTIDASAESGQNDISSNIVGTVEGMASGPNIERRARQALQSGAESGVLALADGQIEKVTPQLLTKAAEQGDVFARQQFQIAGRYLGIGITNILHIFNPDRIVIGGGVWTHASEFLTESIWQVIRERAESPEYWQSLEIVTAALGDDVGLLGAVALAIDNLHNHRVR